jgi:hypothetical protein
VFDVPPIRALFALVFVAAVGLSMALAWGFTVDDALISTRVAHHLANGQGYRFNVDGSLSDAVTPLGWAPLLAPLSGEHPWAGLVAARWLGVGCALLCALLLGLLSWGGHWARRLTVAVPAALCLPLGAWSVSGMETPLVMLLCTLALFEQRALLLSAGLACALRPELIPWALTLGIFHPASGARARVTHIALVLGLPLLVAVTRLVVFGHPAPLAVFAKPSDLEHGAAYVFGGLRLLGVPLLWLAFRPWQHQAPWTRTVALACGVHGMALLAAGGDWMALFRLFVPILPGVLWVGAELSAYSSRWAIALRTLAASGICVLLQLNMNDATRGVWQQRAALCAHAAPHLDGAKNVATLDVGWVGAATPAHVTDLSGVTDIEVALRPGGHTSKQLRADFLLRHGVDALVLLLAPGIAPTEYGPNAQDWRRARFARAVESRVTRLEGAGDFVPVASAPLGQTGQSYLILRKLKERFAIDGPAPAFPDEAAYLNRPP